MVMLENVGSFAIDLGYTYSGGWLQWLPEYQWVNIRQGGWNYYPLGFGLGFNLNLPLGFDETGNQRWWSGEGYNPLSGPLNQASFPQALKFTFTLYDSLGIYEDGKRFTHIVYLDD
jgi:hypothetical protein